MELIRKKNTETKIVFPLLTSGGTAYYTTSAWTSLTNTSKILYSWKDSDTPVSASITNNPTQIASTGLWYLTLTSGETNLDSGTDNYIVVKLKANQIEEQTVLVHLTDYQFSQVADSSNRVNTNQVTVSAYNNFPSVRTSAYTNFPSVNVSAVDSGVLVSADFGTDYYNRIRELQPTTVAVSAYSNFPQVQVSGINSSAVSSATFAAGAITSATFANGAITSADFQQDYYDKILQITPTTVTVSAYSNFPSVNVSSVDTGALVSADFGTDYFDKIQSLSPSISIGEVTVSAYKNFPQVTVSANLDKTNYSISGTKKILDNLNDINGTSVTATSVTDKTGYSITGGTVTSVTNPVSVSAYTNFPQVYVSANGDKTGYSITANSDKTGYSITANTDKTGYILAGSVDVSGYSNFPSVNVSSVTNGAITSADFDNDYWDKVQSFETSVTIGKVQVSGIDGGVYVGTSAYTNFPQVYVSANGDKTGYSITANSDKEGYTLSGSVSVSAYDNFPSVNVSSVNDDVITSADFSQDYWNKIDEIQPRNVVVSAYENFPQVTVSANLDKTNYTVIGGTLDTLLNSVKVSAYENFPSVNVSSMDDGSFVSADFSQDYWNKIDEIQPRTVSVSAYQNFPQVTVSANLDKDNYTVSSGTIDKVNSSISVSAYENFPSVNVSSVDNGTIVSADFDNDYWTRVQLGLATTLQLQNSASQIIVEINNNEEVLNAISANTELIPFVSGSVNDILNNEHGIGSWQSNTQSELSAGSLLAINYYEPPTKSDLETVSAGIVSEIDENGIKIDNVQSTVNTISGFTSGVATNEHLDAVSAALKVEIDINEIKIDGVSAISNDIYNDTQYLRTNSLSANIVEVNGISVVLDDFKNSNQEMYDMSMSAIVDYDPATYNQLTAVNAFVSAGIIEQGNEHWAASASVDEVSAGCVMAIQDQFVFSGDYVVAYAVGGNVSANTELIVESILSATIDSKSFEEIMEILLSMAQGRITRSNNLFTFYKQDNSTALYTLESERSERTRL